MLQASVFKSMMNHKAKIVTVKHPFLLEHNGITWTKCKAKNKIQSFTQETNTKKTILFIYLFSKKLRSSEFST